MMSASPAWKPQATLTEVASSIIAASLPISQGPKLSPRSQLRSIVVMMRVRLRVDGSVRCRDMPGVGVDGADGAAGDVGILQRFEVEIKVFDIAQPVGQGADQLHEAFQFPLRFRHSN